MSNYLERGIAIGLLAFGIGVVHADIVAKNGGSLPSLEGPKVEQPASVRFLPEPRKTNTLMQVKIKNTVNTVDLKGGPIVGGTNLAAQSDSLQTSRYAGSGRRLVNVDKGNDPFPDQVKKPRA